MRPRASHHAHVRQGDITALPVPAQSFDVVVVHQVLHYLDDPARAVREAAKAVAPGGRLLIVDFAPHGLEFLRLEHAHRRLGFAREQMAGWIAAAGLGRLEVRDSAAAGGTGRRGADGDVWLARDERIQMATSEPARQSA